MSGLIAQLSNLSNKKMPDILQLGKTLCQCFYWFENGQTHVVNSNKVSRVAKTFKTVKSIIQN